MTTTDLAQIKSFFSAKIYARGKLLFKENKVKDFTVDISQADFRQVSNVECELFAKVQGSGRNTYTVDLYLYTDGEIDGFCTCPYYNNCKHMAAVLLKYYQQQTDTPSKTQKINNTHSWLESIALDDKNNQSKLDASNRWHTFYKVSLEDSFSIEAIERYQKKNGEWGRSRSAALSYHQQATSQPATQTINTLLHAYETQRLYQDRVSNDRNLLEMKTHALLLAIDTGNAFNVDTNAHFHRGDDIYAEIEWKKQSKGLQPMLRTNTDSDTPLRIIRSSPLLYASIDSEPQVIGKLLTDVNIDHLTLLINAPVIPEKDMNSVYEKLHQVSPKLAESIPERYHPKIIDTVKFSVEIQCADSAESGWLPGFKLLAHYDQHHFELKADDMENIDYKSPVIFKSEKGLLHIQRNKEQELGALEKLPALHFCLYAFSPDTALWIPQQYSPAAHIQHWNRSLPLLKELCVAQNWDIEIAKNYSVSNNTLSSSATFKDHSDGWFNAKFTFELDGSKVSGSDLISAWLNAGGPDEFPYKNKNGHWSMINAGDIKGIYHTLLDLFSGNNTLNKTLRIPTYQAAVLADEIEYSDVKQAPTLKRLRKELKSFNGLQTIAQPKAIKAELRDYQKHGLSWLSFLHKYGLGGVLADDMGLGKTLQTLAFLQKLKSGRKLSKGALIIAPTSLLWNWQSEIHKFSPRLSSLILHGPQRAPLFKQVCDTDIIITSYATAQRDLEKLNANEFDVVILDEAQNIKNDRTKSAQTVRQINAGMRLALTGTPLENHLGELWSIMDFVLPSLLSTKEQFSQNYRGPIERDGNERAQQALAKQVAPFMLRRTKEEVMQELPKKTEITQVVHLAPAQQKLYEGIRLSMEKRVRELVKSKGMAKSHIEFLDALLKLRQACIDPRLVKLKQAQKVKCSAKMEWLNDTIPELINEGRKILVFSQFTQMLDLIKTELEALDIKFSLLTGRTRKRQEVIDEFQHGDSRIFLISLKAGGAGLNLTAADTVIHVDPWWNPAVENQATDRAHRMGQDKPVFVYKLVAENTVEEKIQQMQAEKQAIADSLFQGTKGVGLAKSGDQLLALFAKS